MKKLLMTGVASLSLMACKRTDNGNIVIDKPVLGVQKDTVQGPTVQMETTTVKVPTVHTETKKVVVPTLHNP